MLETILFHRKESQTLFHDYFCRKTENERTVIFRPKPQVNPFGKICKNATIWSAYFYTLETILFYRKDPQTLFEDLALIKLEPAIIWKLVTCQRITSKRYSTSMGRHLSPRYGQVILVSGYPALTVGTLSTRPRLFKRWIALSNG